MTKQLVAFDLDGTLALSKQALDDDMAGRLAGLLEVAHVAIISGGDWPQFEKQVIARMPAGATLERFHILPTTGTKLYQYDGEWKPVYAELFSDEEKHKIITALDDAMKAEGFDQGQTWGERIEDRGSQITFSALGQQAPLEAKDKWDPDHAKRRKLQERLRPILPGLSINSGGATSIDVTREGVDKAYGLRKLSEAIAIPLDAMIFIGDAIFPGGNDYPAKTLGLDCIQVRTVDDTRYAVEGITLALK